MKKILLILMIGVVILLFRMLMPAPEPVAYEYYDEELDSGSDPVQRDTGEEPFYVRIKNGTMKLTPKAEYDITARIAHKKRYRSGWTAEISNYDLALAWGKLNGEDVLPHIKYSQSGRWYHYRYDASCPLTMSYISAHSANTHIIHANENLLRVLKIVKENDVLRMEGYLVYADGFVKGNEAWWHSSLTRQDTGDGACEVFYVKRIWHRGKIYE